MFQDSNVRTFPGKSAGMSLKPPARMFQDKTAETTRERNALQSPASRARWCQEKNASRSAKIFIGAKFVKVIQGKLFMFIYELAKNLNKDYITVWFF